MGLKLARRRARRSKPGRATSAPGPARASDLTRLKAVKRQLIERHVRPNNLKGLAEVCLTLLPIAALAYASWRSLELSFSYLLTAAITLLASLFLLRAFVLMHECGHGSLFRSGRLNRGFGFVFGVISGMPQFVWSQHHQFHHAHNGNWDRYRGPLSIVTAAHYDAMSSPQQRRYRNARNIWLAPFGGFMYAIVNPRLTWAKGSLALLRHVLEGLRSQPGVSLGALAASFKTRCWSSLQEYRHMSANNAALLALWGLMAWLMGPLLFIAFFMVGLALASGAGLVLFTVQHNFEHSYASGSEGWDFTRGAIEGTSFLVLPRWLNWFTVSIGYHHIHHLSARIPSYCLVACQNEHAHLFTEVTRIRLAQVPAAVKCILWDTVAQRIVSVAEHTNQGAPRPA
jgi:acyl-lipid omega-6 desaturase (Delta-12 desaturase)